LNSQKNVSEDLESRLWISSRSIRCD